MVLADFLESLLHAALLGGAALALGGVAWGLAVVRAWRGDQPRVAVVRCLALVGAGATLVAVCQAARLAAKTLALSQSLGHDALAEFATTLHFGAGSARVVLALGLAGAAAWLARAPATRRRWLVVGALAAALAVSGGWLSHATGRLQHRGPLVALTVLHQAAVAVWLGGLVQLVALWPVARQNPEIAAGWPALLSRFSRLAMASVSVLILTGVPLAWVYVGTVRGLVGSGYGSLVLTKAALLCVALALAAPSAWTIRRRPAASRSARRTDLPALAEAETIILVMALFTASGLSAQPPAADLPAADQATVAEVVETFRPKVPSLRTPSLDAMRSSRAPGERSADAYRWSNFSHNVAGLILLGTSLTALAGVAARRPWPWAQPVGFVALAAFIYLRAAANEGTWPFGAVELGQLDAEGIQHRLAAVLVLALGVVEWRARGVRPSRTWLPYVVPALAAGGAVLLLTHSHTAFQPKPSFLVQVTHTTMGALGALMVTARWLELRLGPPADRLAGGAAALAMLLVALVLLFYREANVVVPTG
ncbi:MAG: copper resistance D family protein [Candidatus Rokuibacteriota bacterium]